MPADTGRVGSNAGKSEIHYFRIWKFIFHCELWSQTLSTIMEIQLYRGVSRKHLTLAMKFQLIWGHVS